MAQYQGFSDVSMGRGAIVIGLAAVIIGEVIFGKLFRNFALKLLAVSLGAIIYYLVIQVVLWLGLNTDQRPETEGGRERWLSRICWFCRTFGKPSIREPLWRKRR